MASSPERLASLQCGLSFFSDHHRCCEGSKRAHSIRSEVGVSVESTTGPPGVPATAAFEGIRIAIGRGGRGLVMVAFDLLFL
jgi:hypothetical protein